MNFSILNCVSEVKQEPLEIHCVQNSLEPLKDSTPACKNLFAITFCASTETEQEKIYVGIMHVSILITMNTFSYSESHKVWVSGLSIVHQSFIA